MYRFLYLLILIICVCSCEQEHDKSEDLINLDYTYKTHSKTKSILPFINRISYVELEKSYPFSGNIIRTIVDKNRLYLLSFSFSGNTQILAFDKGTGELEYSIISENYPELDLRFCTDINVNDDGLFALIKNVRKIYKFEKEDGTYIGSSNIPENFSFFQIVESNNILFSRNFAVEETYNLAIYNSDSYEIENLMTIPLISKGIARMHNNFFYKNQSSDEIIIHSSYGDTIYSYKVNEGVLNPTFMINRAEGGITNSYLQKLQNMDNITRMREVSSNITNNPEYGYPIGFIGKMKEDILLITDYYQSRYFWHVYHISNSKNRTIEIEKSDINVFLGPYPILMDGNSILFLVSGEFLYDSKLRLDHSDFDFIENEVVRNTFKDIYTNVNEKSNSHLISIQIEWDKFFNI